jgi:hypothetical protein
VRHRRNGQVNSHPVHAFTTDDIQLHRCRFQDLEVEPGSAQLILTDIPYTKDFLPQVREVAEFVARVLVEGGLFASAVGKAYLPHYFAEFGRCLEWGWLCCTSWQGGFSCYRARNCVDRFTPWLVYSKGKWGRRTTWWDRCDSPGIEKDHHLWQKSLPEVEHWLRCFSTPGDLVCDPCAGSFTTAVACALHNRRFVGCDCEQENVLVGQQRVAQVLASEDSLVSQER